ncbi:flavin reductase family protein [Ochrobactrum sp. GPK 3]|jgi:flavin reductase (NADH)/cob(II)yrinic acid a,c-diamide reductase|uniref:flavin reductase family protein n=1 Tax=Brucella TaxID=234 RepID=UPI00110DB217|nr:flavin reductase family protein [Brucella haematophila]KAB2700225.1 flavin reductase [Ochrobactrum sp. Kaboul]TMV06049.1 flavin reductase [Brucella haematophila]
MIQPATDQLTDDFRSAMRQLAATVNIITAGEGDQRRGLTATAVCSMSLTPPSMLVCVNRFGEAHKAITSAGSFCVNILADRQREVAMRFAGQIGQMGEDKFAPYRWTSLATGAPALDDAMANLDCEIATVSETDSHSIFIGNVKAIRFGPETSPLLHYNRNFFTLANQNAL